MNLLPLKHEDMIEALTDILNKESGLTMEQFEALQHALIILKNAHVREALIQVNANLNKELRNTHYQLEQSKAEAGRLRTILSRVGKLLQETEHV